MLNSRGRRMLKKTGRRGEGVGGGGGEGGRGGYTSHFLYTTGQVMAALPSLHVALNMAQLDCIFHAQNMATLLHNASVNSVQILRR